MKKLTMIFTILLSIYILNVFLGDLKEGGFKFKEKEDLVYIYKKKKKKVIKKKRLV